MKASLLPGGEGGLKKGCPLVRSCKRIKGRVTFVVLALLLFMVLAGHAEHPSLYVSNSDKEAIRAKIRDEPWAAEAWKKLLTEIDPVVDRTLKDPQWAVSRLAMYWKDGEHYTQCYLKDENWDRGEGNAPVPTVRLPGMRVWNDHSNVPLEDRIPFNGSGDMLAKSRKDPSAPAKLVPYKESGHLVRANNAEILTLAEKAAFAHWITGEEKYAKFAADIYWTWLLGTYHMKPPLDPGKSSGGPGGYAPGGILGYYDYEQIHDDLMSHAAPIHDFLHDYLAAHPHPHLADLRKDLDTVTGEVFKRFIDIGFVRGSKTGNWNVNGWNVMMRGILCLESDSFYPDGKGREHYLRYYTAESTPYHNAVPDILRQFDPVTGLWPESPGYSLGVINTLFNMALPVYRAGTDTIAGNPMMGKAAFAEFAWMDPRGNMVVFGDTRGGPASFSLFERLLTYHTWKNDPENAAIASAAIRKGVEAGQYNRSSVGWEGICLNAPLAASGDTKLPLPRVAYSAEHRHIVMRNLNDERNGLMFTLYGGTKGKHLSPNGLALQLYGKGWALSPDASGYESYWSKDYHYHQSATGANTILPGYKEGPITINAMEPAPPPGAFTAERGISPDISFADVTAGEKRRVVAMIRTSPASGYYADIFRSRQERNDYLHHNLGDSLALMDPAGIAMPQSKDATLDPVPAKEYSFFGNIRKTSTDAPFRAVWTIAGVSPPIRMALWMNGGRGREIFQVDAPPTNLNPSVSPAGTCIAPKSTPTLIVRQHGTDGWKSPFVAVFEPYEGERGAVTKVSSSQPEDDFTVLEVESRIPSDGNPQIKDTIMSSTDRGKAHAFEGITLQGDFAVVRKGGAADIDLYLGSGLSLSCGGATIAASEGRPLCARLYRTPDGWRYSSDGKVGITLPDKRPIVLPPARDAKVAIGI